MPITSITVPFYPEHVSVKANLGKIEMRDSETNALVNSCDFTVELVPQQGKGGLVLALNIAVAADENNNPVYITQEIDLQP